MGSPTYGKSGECELPDKPLVPQQEAMTMYVLVTTGQHLSAAYSSARQLLAINISLDVQIIFAVGKCPVQSTLDAEFLVVDCFNVLVDGPMGRSGVHVYHFVVVLWCWLSIDDDLDGKAWNRVDDSHHENGEGDSERGRTRLL